MNTKFKSYSREEVKQIFKDYETHTLMVNSENEVVFFKFEDCLVSGECELIAEDDEFYWAISYDSKHNFQGGDQSLSYP